MEVKKLITMPKDLAINVQAIATLEDRSFNAQVRTLLNEALTNRTIKDEENN